MVMYVGVLTPCIRGLSDRHNVPGQDNDTITDDDDCE